MASCKDALGNERQRAVGAKVYKVQHHHHHHQRPTLQRQPSRTGVHIVVARFTSKEKEHEIINIRIAVFYDKLAL